MSVSEHVLDLIPASALGILDEAEKQRVSEHLESCSSCAAELRAYQEIVADLPLGTLQVNPPPDLKNKILQQARQVKQDNAAQIAPLKPVARVSKPGWLEALRARLSLGVPAWGWISLALIVFLGASNLFLWQRLNRVETDYQQISDQYQNTLRTVPLMGTDVKPDAIGLLIISKDGTHGTVVVDRLPVLDETQQYQLWLMKDGQRTSGGIFSVDEDGYGAKWIGSPDPLASYQSFGLTIEPAGGSLAPTGEKVLGGDL